MLFGHKSATIRPLFYEYLYLKNACKPSLYKGLLPLTFIEL